jgi:hypothetical protein
VIDRPEGFVIGSREILFWKRRSIFRTEYLVQDPIGYSGPRNSDQAIS